VGSHHQPSNVNNPSFQESFDLHPMESQSSPRATVIYYQLFLHNRFLTTFNNHKSLWETVAKKFRQSARVLSHSQELILNLSAKWSHQPTHYQLISKDFRHCREYLRKFSSLVSAKSSGMGEVLPMRTQRYPWFLAHLMSSLPMFQASHRQFPLQPSPTKRLSQLNHQTSRKAEI
jgi:hypothetical protein